MRILILASRNAGDKLTLNLIETNYSFRPTFEPDRSRLLSYLEHEADLDRTDAFITVWPDGAEVPSFLSSLDGEYIDTFTYEFEKWPEAEPVAEVVGA